MIKKTEDRFCGIWKLDRVICRLVAAWSWFAVFVLTREGDFKVLSFGQEYSLSVVGLWTLGNFVIFMFVALALYPYHSDSWFLIGGATACVWIWLVKAPSDTNGELFWLATAAVYVLFMIYFVHANKLLFERWNPGKKTVIAVAVTAAVVSCAVISVITCLRYKTFSSPNYDFGLFVNMFHNMI